MALKVYTAAAVAANTPWTLTVPGQRIWNLQSCVAVLSRAVGGTPNRAIKLTITDGTSTIVGSPCADAGTEPGTLTCTWCNAQPTSVASGATGVSVGPLPPIRLLPGYIISAVVSNGAVADQWTSAVAWVDEVDT